MILKESGQMYLETLLILSHKLAHVRSLDIAEYMGYSKPSVSRAVGILKKGNYISADENGYLSLTDLGAEIANKIYERHTCLTEFFLSLGVDAQTAAADACKIEHTISDESFDAIKHYAKQLCNKQER